MPNKPHTINKYQQAELVDRHDIERSECSEDDKDGCPYYSEDRDEAIRTQADRKNCDKPNCKK